MLSLSEGLGPTRRNDLDLDSVRVFTVQSIVVRPSGIRILRLVESCVAAAFDPGGNFIDVGSRYAFEGKMIEANSFTVIAGREMF